MAVEVTIGAAIPPAAVIPFACLLPCIAVLPLLAPHFWGRNRNQAHVAAACAAAGRPDAVGARRGWRAPAAGQGPGYVSFIALIGTLFVVAGGIHARGSQSGTPLMNTALLACGAVAANLVGTAGASMLLAHPLLPQFGLVTVLFFRGG